MHKIKHQLKQIQNEANPSLDYKQVLLNNLQENMQIDSKKQVFKYSFGIALVALFVMTGTGVYAYESPEVTDGHVLNGLKRNIERIEGRFASNPEKKAKFHAKMMDRRLNECDRVPDGEKKQLLLEKAAEQLDLSLDQLKEQIQNPETRAGIIEQLAEQNQGLAQMLQNRPESFKKGQGLGQGQGQGFGPMPGKHKMMNLPEEYRTELQGLHQQALEEDWDKETRHNAFKEVMEKWLEKKKADQE
ncbi:DUF5667 domain-containing protein [Patescibacteria group bacterium]